MTLLYLATHPCWPRLSCHPISSSPKSWHYNQSTHLIYAQYFGIISQLRLSMTISHVYACAGVQHTLHCHNFQFSPSMHIHINTTIMQFYFNVDTQLHLPQVLPNIFSQQSNTQFVYLRFHYIYNTGLHVNYQNIRLTRLSFISLYNNPINCDQTLNLNFFSLS